MYLSILLEVGPACVMDEMLGLTRGGCTGGGMCGWLDPLGRRLEELLPACGGCAGSAEFEILVPPCGLYDGLDIGIPSLDSLREAVGPVSPPSKPHPPKEKYLRKLKIDFVL